MAFLEISSLSKSYGDGAKRVEVLSDIRLKVDEGEFIAIVGFSGSGKTTLISALAGLLKPDTGGVIFRGKEVTVPGPERGRGIPVLFADALALRARQCGTGGQFGLLEEAEGGAPGDHRPLHRHGRADPCPRSQAGGIVRRHAPAGCRGPGARHAAGSPVDGRAAFRARRADPVQASGRVRRNLHEGEEDDRAHHQRCR